MQEHRKLQIEYVVCQLIQLALLEAIQLLLQLPKVLHLFGGEQLLLGDVLTEFIQFVELI